MTNEQLKQILETLNNVSSHTLELYAQKAFVEGVIGTTLAACLLFFCVFCVKQMRRKGARDIEGWMIGALVSGIVAIVSIACTTLGLFVPEAMGLDSFLSRVF